MFGSDVSQLAPRLVNFVLTRLGDAHRQSTRQSAMFSQCPVGCRFTNRGLVAIFGQWSHLQDQSHGGSDDFRLPTLAGSGQNPAKLGLTVGPARSRQNRGPFR